MSIKSFFKTIATKLKTVVAKKDSLSSNANQKQKGKNPNTQNSSKKTKNNKQGPKKNQNQQHNPANNKNNNQQGKRDQNNKQNAKQGNKPQQQGGNKQNNKQKNHPQKPQQQKQPQQADKGSISREEIAKALQEDKFFAIPPVELSWDASEFQVPVVDDKKRFHEFDLPNPIMHAIYDLGFQYCTPIQAETLDKTMSGLNVAGKAQTGTGKTAAFLISILKRMLSNVESRPIKVGRPAALVLAPTRELVMQIQKDAEALGKYCGLRSIAIFGGMDYDKQLKTVLEAPVDLVAATPGRLLDFSRNHVLDLRGIQTLVIDEADRMLDMGFIPDVRRIVRLLPEKNMRQTLLFSATLNDEVMRLAEQWMPNPVQVSVDPEHGTVDTISQLVYPIAAREKFTVLYNILKSEKYGRTIIFRNRKRDCEELVYRLARQGITAEMLSGDVDQKKRCRILEDFRSGKVKLVVATDVAGRGIHVDDISLVVNYDFPYEADDYIHRIGRTGRAGTMGTAVSFACEDESFIIPDIETLLGEPLHCQQPSDELFAEVPAPTTDVPRKKPASNNGSGPHARGFGGGRKPQGNFRRGPRPPKK